MNPSYVKSVINIRLDLAHLEVSAHIYFSIKMFCDNFDSKLIKFLEKIMLKESLN